MKICWELSTKFWLFTILVLFFQNYNAVIKILEQIYILMVLYLPFISLLKTNQYILCSAYSMAYSSRLHSLKCILQFLCHLCCLEIHKSSDVNHGKYLPKNSQILNCLWLIDWQRITGNRISVFIYSHKYTLACWVQFLDETDPFSSTNFPLPVSVFTVQHTAGWDQLASAGSSQAEWLHATVLPQWCLPGHRAHPTRAKGYIGSLLEWSRQDTKHSILLKTSCP